MEKIVFAIMTEEEEGFESSNVKEVTQPEGFLIDDIMDHFVMWLLGEGYQKVTISNALKEKAEEME